MRIRLSGSIAALVLCSGASAVLAEETRATFRAPTMEIEAAALPKPLCAPLKPIVPDQAIAMNITGTVLVEYTVNADGRVGQISLAKSTAHPALAEAVKTWLDGCSFTPHFARGKTISLRMIQPFVFRQG